MKINIFQSRIRALLVAGLACGMVVTSKFDSRASNIFSVQSRVSSPAGSDRWQLFVEIDGLSGGPIPPTPATLFSPAGGVYAMTFLNGTVYGVELENGTFVDYLVTIPHEGFFIGQGSRVGTAPIGMSNIEGMAAVNGTLIVSALNYAQHMTTFLNVDPQTGVGTPIGNSGFDEMIVGLAFDPVTQTLYGAGIPFGDGVQGIPDPNLFTIDPLTGATTMVGNLGMIIQGLAWDSELGLIGSFDRFYTIDTTTGLATALGNYDYTDGVGTGPGIFNGLYGLAAVPPEVVAPLLPFDINNIEYSRNGTAEVVITWESVPGAMYQLWHNTEASVFGWTPVGEVVEAMGDTASQTHTPTAEASEGYYQVSGEPPATSP